MFVLTLVEDVIEHSLPLPPLLAVMVMVMMPSTDPINSSLPMDIPSRTAKIEPEAVRRCTSLFRWKPV
jgi:hypothetical protein